MYWIWNRSFADPYPLGFYMLYWFGADIRGHKPLHLTQTPPRSCFHCVPASFLFLSADGSKHFFGPISRSVLRAVHPFFLGMSAVIWEPFESPFSISKLHMESNELIHLYDKTIYFKHLSRCFLDRKLHRTFQLLNNFVVCFSMGRS